MSVCEIKRSHDVDIMSVSKLFLILLLLFVFAAPIFASGTLKVNGENVVASAIDEAEESMASAYEAVLDAEQAGADVSGLLVNLTVAGEYLANAHVWYELGNYYNNETYYENATLFANNCYNIGTEVRNSAEELKIKAYESWIGDLWIRIISSIVGIVAVVFGTFIAWRVFKKRYFRVVIRDEEEATVIET